MLHRRENLFCFHIILLHVEETHCTKNLHKRVHHGAGRRQKEQIRKTSKLLHGLRKIRDFFWDN